MQDLVAEYQQYQDATYVHPFRADTLSVMLTATFPVSKKRAITRRNFRSKKISN
jgi:hypothetical protein